MNAICIQPINEYKDRVIPILADLAILVWVALSYKEKLLLFICYIVALQKMQDLLFFHHLLGLFIVFL